MREIIKLRDGWKFKLEGAGDKFAWYKGFADDFGDWKSVNVPHDWAVEYPFTQDESSGTGYVVGGVGWYRTSFELLPQKDKHVTVTFEGVYNNAKVWVNSNYLGKRPYGYSTFVYDITPFLSLDGNNVIAVQVNHTETADSRWYTGSGIVRPVYVTVRDMPYVEDFGIHVTTESLNVDMALIKVAADVSCETATLKHTVIAPSGEIVAEFASDTAEILSPLAWSPDSPSLYKLISSVITKDKKTNVEIASDVVETLFGIRTVEFDADRGFFLNGERTKLKGVCVHHDAGCLGAAVPKFIWEQRLETLRECGCNAIRTSHNPPDTTLLDVCDEMGFLVIDEAFDEWEMPKNKWWHGHNVNPPKMNGYYEDFPAWGEIDIKTMVKRDRNHPSIIMWSIGNEVDYPNDPYVHHKFETMTGNNDAGKSESERKFDINRPNAERLKTIAENLVKWVKECDISRPVTAGLAYPEVSTIVGYMQALDVAGYNYKEHLYGEHHRNFPNSIFYGSENGHGWGQWIAVRDNDYISGQFLWTGIDYLGEAHGWPVRASGAGLMTLAGFKKDRWYHRKTMWREDDLSAKLFVKKAENEENRRRWRPSFDHWNFADGELINVICYTNCDSGELFVNGKRVAEALFDEGMINFGDIVHEAGEIEVVCKKADVDGKFTDKITTAANAKKIKTTVYNSQNGEIVRIELALFDKNGLPVSHADLNVTVTVTGKATLLGLENGNISDLTPYTSDSRKTCEGKLAIYVRKFGEADIHISPDGIAETALKI